MAYTVFLKTVQANAIKILVETLKDLLIDTSIVFEPTGVKVVAVDNIGLVMVHLRLEADRFEEYTCIGTNVIGVNLINLHKVIKTVNSSDTLTLCVDEDDPNHLVVRMDNEEKCSRTCYKINLMDLDCCPSGPIPYESYTTIVTLPSIDFQKIVRDMSALSDQVDIKAVGNELSMSCSGDFCTQQTVLINDHGVCAAGEADPSPEIIQGVFKLKQLSHFTKCSSLSPMVDIYLRNDYPLIVKYQIASLGELRMCLSAVDTGA